MRDIDIIRNGYNHNQYNEKYREGRELESQEITLMDSFVSSLRKPKKVLDVGCGCAHPFDTYLISKGVTLTGIDISEKQIGRARQNCPAGTFICGEFLEKLDQLHKVNGIVCFYCIFHFRIEQLEEVFKGMHTLLDTGGKLLMNVRGNGYEQDTRESATWCGNLMVWEHTTTQRYVDILTSCGFKCSTVPCEYNEPYAWICATKI